ncbi:hypothetical protein [Streptacidiphilus albus]|jgi:hypothetical protein|uniref:hypothetical protein n=1 Tax=Streptacidiphilus albus TaxID=105425 RepID=UPI00128D2333|nr:hypothetical protein [Streptacidiphilus albus]
MSAMEAPVAPQADWLLNEHAIQAFAMSAILLAAGYGWDAVRTPEALGLAAAKRLLGSAITRNRLGPVLHSHRSGVLYWIVRTGSTSHYPTGCQLLRRGDWIAAPGDHALHPDIVRWLHLPEPGVLTSAVWLAAALHDTQLPGGTR